MRRILLLATACLGLAAAPLRVLREGKGPALVLVHGYGGNVDVWKELLPELAKRHTVLRVELPSGPELPLRPDGAADLEAVAKELAARVREEGLAPCVLAGHSMGGPLAAMAVMQDPKAFRGLVLVDSFLGPVPAAALDPVIAGLARDPKATLEAFYGRGAAGPAQRDRLVREALRLPAPTLQAYARAMTQLPPAARGAALKLPVLQLQAGAEDPEPARRQAQQAARGLAGLPELCVVYFPRARHWVMWDEPALFLRALRDFEGGLK